MIAFTFPSTRSRQKPAARIFSPAVVTGLIQASQIGEPLSGLRAQAVRKAVEFAKHVHPDLFQKDEK